MGFHELLDLPSLRGSALASIASWEPWFLSLHELTVYIFRVGSKQEHVCIPEYSLSENTCGLGSV